MSPEWHIGHMVLDSCIDATVACCGLRHLIQSRVSCTSQSPYACQFGMGVRRTPVLQRSVDACYIFSVYSAYPRIRAATYGQNCMVVRLSRIRLAFRTYGGSPRRYHCRSCGLDNPSLCPRLFVGSMEASWARPMVSFPAVVASGRFL